ncbi:MAG: TM1266 family iron-only hydrogenase system putative regulator [Spirochaetota bacterium]|nr:CopG family transcriptional regulator [Exilispira sp.]
MEKRIGIIGIIIEDFSQVETVSQIIHQFQDFILGRQGMNLKDHNLRIISIIMEATTDEFGSFTGKLGRLKGVRVKSILSKKKEDIDDNHTEESDQFYQ